MARIIRGGIFAAGLMAVAAGSGCPGDKGETASEATASETSTPTTQESPTTSLPMVTSSSTTNETSSTTEPAELMRCESLCESDRDCLRDGEDIGFRCIDGVCVYPACTSDANCVAELSGWQKVCAGQDGCDAMEACVEVEGEGRCALEPGLFTCADFGLAELTRAPIEGGRPVAVCGQAMASCVEGECITPCTEATCAPQMGHPFCEPVTGQCVCQIDQDCLDASLVGFVQCIDGRCGCASDSDCAGGTNVDTCREGACGCSSDATCTTMVFDGAPLSCQ